MKKNGRNLFVGLCVMIIVALFSGSAISAESVTIVGTINDNYQIVTDNDQVYEIGDNEKADELMELIDKRVKVTGTVEEVGGAKVITVTSYEVIAK